MIVLDLIVLIVGLLIYALAAGKTAEIGKILFFCGTLAFLLAFRGVIR
jgi:hypothetical protein